MQITSDEAEALAKSLASVASHYDMGSSIAPEAVAWMSLVQTVALVYGPRIFAVRARKSRSQTIDNEPQHVQPGAWPQ